MADDLNINIGANPAGIEAGSRRAKTALQGVVGGSKELEQAFKRFRSTIDPAFQAMEKYNKAHADNLALMRAGVISRREYNAGMKAAKVALDQETASIERNSAAGRAAAAAAKAARQTQAQETRNAALEESRLAREAGAAKRAAVREAAAAAKAAIAEEKAAIRAAAAEAKQLARDVAATEVAAKREAAAQAKAAANEAKADARSKAATEKAEARAAAEVEKAAKREVKEAARSAAAVAKAAATERANAERTAARAAREAAADITRMANAERQAAAAAHELRASIDPAFAAQSRYNSTMATATSLLMQNKLRTGEWTAIQRQAKAQMDLNVRSLGRQNSMYVQLGYQAQDVTASLASGISPLVILAQQGGQTASALSTMGGTAGKVAAFFAGPWGAAIIGATLLLGYLFSEEKKGKDATVDLTDAESRRTATVAKLTEALKDYVKQQREANNSDLENLRIKNNMNFGDTTRLINNVTAAQKKLTEAQADYQAALRTPTIVGPGEAAARGAMLAMAAAKVESAEKSLAAAQKASKQNTDALTESRLALLQAEGEQTAVDIEHKNRQDALTKAYRAQVNVTMPMAQQTQMNTKYLADWRAETDRYTAAKARESAAHTANAKEVRDEAKAYYTSRNDAITRAGRELRDQGYQTGTGGHHPGMGDAAHADHAIDINIPGVKGGNEAYDAVAKERMDKMVAAYQARGFRILWNGKVYNAYGQGASYDIPQGTNQHKNHVHMEAPAELVGKPAGSQLADAMVQDAEHLRVEEQRVLKERADDMAAFYDYQKSLADDDINEQLRLQDLKIGVIKDYYGAESKEAENAMRERVRLVRTQEKQILEEKQNALRESLTIAEDAATAEAAIGDINRGMKGKGVDLAEGSGVVNARQALTMRAQILDEEYAAQVQHERKMYELKVANIRAILALENLEPKKRDELNSQLRIAEAEHLNTLSVMQRGYARDVQGVAIQAAEQTMAKWKDVASTLSSSLTSTFQGLWTHSQTLQQGFINAADQMVYKFVDAGAKIFEQWFLRQVGMTTVQHAQDAARTASTAAATAAQTGTALAGTTAQVGAKVAAGTTEIGIHTATTGAAVAAQGIKTSAAVAGAATQGSVGAAAGMAEIGTRAATSAAGAYSSTVVIPFIGPVAAPVAAAVALAAVLGFGALISARGGQGEVPFDGQLSMLHQKEMVLPAQFAVPLRQMLVSPRSSSGIMGAAAAMGTSAREAGNNSNAVNFHYSPKNNNMGAGFDELLRRDAQSMRKWIKNEVRNGGLVLK